jgi:K+-transporting ATPase ATPase C chain
MKQLLTQASDQLRCALLSFALMTILCGLIYTGFVTGTAQLLFPNQANGSVISTDLGNGVERDYGSALIGQEFTRPEYLIGRPMGVTNLSPTGEKQRELVQERIEWWHGFDPDNHAEIPADLVTASGSGVDPHITPAAAEYQVQRIAEARGIQVGSVRELIQQCSSGRFLGFWGEPSVNVLRVNLLLDQMQQEEDQTGAF